MMHQNPEAPLTNFGGHHEDAEQQIESLRCELTVTRELLHLTELRLHAALGMPPQELARCVQALNARGTAPQGKAGGA